MFLCFCVVRKLLTGCNRCNPAEWEGDFRLWESLLSGALVFVDWITAFERMPYLLDKKHLIIYNRKDQTGFLKLLEHYVTHEDEARSIATAGQKFARAHHMAANRIDYLLMHLVASEEEKESNPNYCSKCLDFPNQIRKHKK